ncbi:protein MROH8 [Pitangus sulphuratus]|nr:protein MROH8 [Pitangus sulphuratus]
MVTVYIKDPLQLSLLSPPLDTSWLPLYRVKQKALDFLQDFDRSPYQGENDKRMFLENIIYVCSSALDTGLLEGLEIFFQNINLVETIKMLLEEEPKKYLHSPVRELAMRAITVLSAVGTVLEGKRRGLLEACISCIFWLPSDKGMRQRNKYYSSTLDAMDVMLEAMVFNSPPPRVVEELQHVLEMLLDLTNSESIDVQVRAVERIGNLSYALSMQKHWPDDFRVNQISILGQLLGRLLCFQFSEGKTKSLASRAFYYLCQFIFAENRRMSYPEEHYKKHLRLPVTFLQWCNNIRAQIKALECYLTPCERTYIMLAAIEAMQDASTPGHHAARYFLQLAMRSPDLWLTDVPSIVRGIQECLEHISLASDVESLDILLTALAHKFPRELVRSMLTSTAPYDSTALAVWDQMYSQNNIRSKFWMELQGRVHSEEEEDRELFSPTVLYTIRVYKVILNPINTEIVELLKDSQKCPKPEFLSLALTGLCITLENPETARRLRFLLPDIVEHLQHTNKTIRLKALRVLQIMVHRVGRKNASNIAVRLLEQLLPLFDDECTEVREYSIFLFKQLVEAAVCWDMWRMKRKARKGVMPLLLHMTEMSESVAQLEKDMNRVEEYLEQSWPYLHCPQATVRETALRFTREPQPPESLFGQPGP